jgi:uncharacterized membrane protein
VNHGFSIAGEVYALYLAHIERNVIHMWCLYCVISLGIMSAIVIVAAIWTVMASRNSKAQMLRTG